MIRLLVICVLNIVLPSNSENIKIYEWRGKDRLGIYDDTNLLREWPADGPKELWSVEDIGEGFVTPVFDEDNFYLTGEKDSTTLLYCFNLKGVKKWQTNLGGEWMKTYPGARSAPTIVNNLLYIGTGLGNFFCINKENGRIIWSKDLASDFNGILPMHGHSEAALIDGDKVFWTAGGKEYNVIAMNRFTGKMIWSNKGFGERSAYNPPKLIVLPERSIIVTFSAYHMMGLDTETGKLLFSHEQDNFPMNKRIYGNGDTHSNTVIYDNGSIYYAAGDGNGGVKLNLTDGGTKITQAWRNKGFDSYMGGIVKIGDYLYGSGTASPDIRSINATTGQLSDSLRIGSGALIAADNMLYYYTQKGDMNLVKYNQGKLEKISSFRIKKGSLQHFSHPVINKGILYQRHGNALMAYDIKKQ